MVSALVWNTGSGRAAIATLLTLAAATAPPAMPANRKKSLLEFMMVSLRGSVACTSLGSGCTAARDANAGGLANERRLQSGVRQPELLFGVQGRHHRVHLIAGVSKQLENADQHPVVAKLVFFGDGFSQRDHLVAVVARDFIRRAVRGIALAQVRGCIEDRVAPYTQLDVREGRDRVPALRACGCVVVGLRDLQIQTSLGRLAASVRWGQRLLG